MKMNHCLIISGGEYSPIEYADRYDYVIACDHGYDHARRCGILPNLIIGDFDSYSGTLPENVPVMQLQCEKDDTDTMVAIRYAIDNGCAAITLTCTLGGRFDHAFANIQGAHFAAARGVRTVILESDSEFHFLTGCTEDFPRREDYSLSVFSLTNTCDGVTLSGVKYPLQNARLTNTFPIGVSNEWRADNARVGVTDGMLMVVFSRMQQM